MAEHGLERQPAFHPINVVIGVPLKLFWAIRATAKVQFRPGPLQCGGPLHWLFSQAGWGYTHIPGLMEVPLRIGLEQIEAPAATEMVFITLVAVAKRLVLADP